METTGYSKKYPLNRSSSIFLSDLVSALVGLAPQDEAAMKGIAEALGFRLEVQTRAGSPPSVSPQVSKSQDQPSSRPSRDEAIAPRSIHEIKPVSDLPSSRARVVPIEKSSSESIPSRVSSSLSRTETTEKESWLAPITALSRPAHSEEFTPLPVLDPLFVPIWVRGILSGALSTPSEDGPLAIDPLIDMLARGQPIEKFWRIMRPTARRGVQVLIDDGEALAPYARDQKELLQEIRRVIGQEKVEVIHFIGTPLRKENAVPTTKDYKTPPFGTPVLLLTDLGIGRPLFSVERASIQEWLKFVAFVNKAGCRVTAFVPYSQNRWPRILTHSMKIISWDRSTTANASRSWKN